MNLNTTPVPKVVCTSNISGLEKKHTEHMVIKFVTLMRLLQACFALLWHYPVERETSRPLPDFLPFISTRKSRSIGKVNKEQLLQFCSLDTSEWSLHIRTALRHIPTLTNTSMFLSETHILWQQWKNGGEKERLGLYHWHEAEVVPLLFILWMLFLMYLDFISFLH